MANNKRNCMIVGARGGIGSKLFDVLVADPEVGHVIATHRIPVEQEEYSGKVTWLALDLESPLSIDRAAASVRSEFDSLDCLICASGLLHDSELQPEKCFAHLTSENLSRVFQVNAAGPIALLAGLAPVLKKSSAPKVLLLSAQVGSIGDNRMGGWYSYRMSKAALNMGIRCAAIEADRWQNNAVVMSVHPGTTDTGLSAPFIKNRKQYVRDSAESAANILDLLREAGSEHHGGFFTAQGKALPW